MNQIDRNHKTYRTLEPFQPAKTISPRSFLRTCSLVLLLATSHQAFGQWNADKSEILRKELFKQINDHRESLGLQRLVENEILQEAALNQSKYMSKNDVLSHEQKSGSGKTPEKRVRNAGEKDFERVGENVLFSEFEESELKKGNLEKIASQLFEIWKNSPPHYANMTSSNYTLGDLDFAYNSRTHKLFATQVFAAEKATVEGQLSSNAFGIQMPFGDCNSLSMFPDNWILSMLNGISLSNDTIYFSYQDINFFKEVFSGSKDGIAIDALFIDQFECGEPNSLDGSKVYDGILLRPIYRDELLKNNCAVGPNRLKTPIGILPKDLQDLEVFHPSVIAIKNGQVCEYLIPMYVPHKPYDLNPIALETIQPDLTLLNQGVLESEIVSFSFETNQVVSENQPSQKIKGKRIHSVDIVSYSSIEGDSISNLGLHKNRGKFIEQYVNQNFGLNRASVSHEEYENWDKFYFQLSYSFADSLLDKPRAYLRELVVSGDTSLDWSSLLHAQRESNAFINYYGELDANAPLQSRVNMSLRTAVATKNWALANRALHELYRDESLDASIVFEGQIYNVLLNRSELVQNAAAVMSRVYELEQIKATAFLRHWVDHQSELTTSEKTNLLYLYSLTGYYLVQHWDVSSQRLSNVIKPALIRKLTYPDVQGKMQLNLNLVFLYYFGHILDRAEMRSSFDWITNYVQKVELDQEELTNLVLFANDWTRCDLAISLLNPSFDQGTISDENLITLMHTLAHTTDSDGDKSRLIQVVQKAREIDPEYVCAWMQEEYQILRNLELKEFFCRECGFVSE